MFCLSLTHERPVIFFSFKSQVRSHYWSVSSLSSKNHTLLLIVDSSHENYRPKKCCGRALVPLSFLPRLELISQKLEHNLSKRTFLFLPTLPFHSLNTHKALHEWLKTLLHFPVFHLISNYFSDQSPLSELSLTFLSRGAYGHVYCATLEGKKYAFKCIPLNELTACKDLQFACQQLIHANVIPFLDYFIVDAKELYLKMPCATCDLATLIKHFLQKPRSQNTSQPIMPQFAIQKILVDLCEALLFLKKHNIFHRDLKPQNIGWFEDEGVFKLLDFGSCGFKTSTQKLSSEVTTYLYASPEQLQKMPYTEKCEVWSLGCVLLELWTGKTLYTQTSNFCRPLSPLFLYESLPSLLRELYSSCPEVLKPLCLGMLQFTAAQRLTLLQAYRLCHTF